MKKINIILSIAVLALSVSTFGQIRQLKSLLAQEKNPVMVVSMKTSPVLASRTEARADSPVILTSYHSASVDVIFEIEMGIAHEKDIACESWEDTEPLPLEEWMSTPFETEVSEESLELEDWMTEAFVVPEMLELEDWMLTPFYARR